MTEPVEAALPLRRGFVRLGGRPLVQHQLDMAIAAHCERLICLVRALEPEVIALKHRAEAAGIQFNTVTATRDLSALVSAQDDLIVIYEGLLADPAVVAELIELGSGVFVQPVEIGLAAGFERVDINHATAGLLRIPGRLVETLMQMPPDCDVASTLTRIALQARLELREIPAAARSGPGWHLITSENQAHAIEPDWIASKLADSRRIGPGQRIARAGVSVFGAPLLHAGNASATSLTVTLVLLVVALAVAWFGFATGAFVLCALAWVTLCSAAMLRRLERPASIAESPRYGGLTAIDWAFDAVVVLLIHWAAPPVAGTGRIEALALPVTMMLLLRICGQHQSMSAVASLADRSLLCLLLAACALMGILEWTVALGVVALAGVILAISSNRSG